MLSWLTANESLATWIQAIGVVAAIAFGMVQLRRAKDAIEAAVSTNEIALRNSTSNLLVGINQAALNNPDLAGDYAGHRRLHLLRLHYFYRTFQLRQAGLLDDESFHAEEQYFAWTAGLPDFPEAWKAFRLQYPPGFRDWADGLACRERSNSETASSSESSAP